MDKPLFTPGPLTTSATVKAAMLRDLGSREREFTDVVAAIRTRLLELAGVSVEGGYEAVLLQGSGTYAVEAVIAAQPAGRSVLVLVNGAYGRRIAGLVEHHGLACVVQEEPEHAPADPALLERTLSEHPEVDLVALVHLETTSGVLNPLDELAAVARRHAKPLFVDAMSSFGALPVDPRGWGADFLVSSANKCIEGVPGFAYVLARRDALLALEGHARSLSLDLVAQWRGLENNGQFRFTPPTHALLAFAQALDELEEEGGVAGRGARYADLHALLTEGMQGLGFEPVVAPEHQGPIITSFAYPTHDAFSFQGFYEALLERGFVIYPGKLSKAPCFRIGTVGRLTPDDVDGLLRAVEDSLAAMGIPVPLPSGARG